jgi:hypothetical protein
MDNMNNCSSNTFPHVYGLGLRIRPTCKRVCFSNVWKRVITVTVEMPNLESFSREKYIDYRNVRISIRRLFDPPISLIKIPVIRISHDSSSSMLFFPGLNIVVVIDTYDIGIISNMADHGKKTSRYWDEDWRILHTEWATWMDGINPFGPKYNDISSSFLEKLQNWGMLNGWIEKLMIPSESATQELSNE